MIRGVCTAEPLPHKVCSAVVQLQKAPHEAGLTVIKMAGEAGEEYAASWARVQGQTLPVW